LYEHPASEFVARFLGLSNLLTGVVTRVDGESATVETADGVLTARAAGVAQGARVTVLIRPNAAQAFLAASDALGQANRIACRVVEARFGERTRVLVETRSGARLWFESAQMLRTGAEVWVDLNSSVISILPIRNPQSEIRNPKSEIDVLAFSAK
jgi:ABC-type Fe3+/spermidine/putrescine transport system ATPase subunit